MDLSIRSPTRALTNRQLFPEWLGVMLDNAGHWWPMVAQYSTLYYTSTTHLVYHQAFYLDFLAPQYQQVTSACAWGAGFADHSLAAAILEEIWSPVSKNSDCIKLHDPFLFQQTEKQKCYILQVHNINISAMCLLLELIESAMYHNFLAVARNQHTCTMFSELNSLLLLFHLCGKGERKREQGLGHTTFITSPGFQCGLVADGQVPRSLLQRSQDISQHLATWLRDL